MADDEHGIEETKVAQAPQDGSQQAQEDVQVEGMDWQSAIKERDGRIAELEAQVAEASKTAEAAEALRGEIAELKAQGEDQRVEFELRLAGVRNVKAAKAILADHGGDVSALMEAEPWLFDGTPDNPKGGRTGLPNAGASGDEGRLVRHWRRLAGLEDDNEQ
ncbi:MAG: hypothetical protein IKG18_15830 [Atopobiaceae bacterium]|nr:hypothetical protein [Atopobiaceae bacterium]